MIAALEKLVQLDKPHDHIIWGDGVQWVLMAGPDVLESEALILEVAQELKSITSDLQIPWVFKCSFDKANRQGLRSFRGLGFRESLRIFSRVKSKVNCPLLTDIHETCQIEPVAEVADILQIPAFLSRQTDLVVGAGKTGRVIHVKKGQFLAPWDMSYVVEKIISTGNERILLCERGTVFGYNRLVNDMTALVEMRKLGYPVIYDGSHSVQLPGALGASSGGRREMIAPLCRAAIAVGVDGIFLETHPDPDRALCDGPNSFPLRNLKALLQDLKTISNSFTVCR